MSAAAAALAPAGVRPDALQALYDRHVVRPYILGQRYSTAAAAAAAGGRVAARDGPAALGAGPLGDPLDTLMNGPIRAKLNAGPGGKVIPDTVTWGGQSDAVFSSLSGACCAASRTNAARLQGAPPPP